LVGLVRLDEGPTMTSFVLAAGRLPAVGDTVELKPTRIGGRTLPAFLITSKEI
jgi:hypothetical protein